MCDCLCSPQSDSVSYHFHLSAKHFGYLHVHSSEILLHFYLQEASAKVDTFAANANKLRDVTGRATRTLQQTIAAIEAELVVILGVLAYSH